jgi:hypothetical protein
MSDDTEATYNERANVETPMTLVSEGLSPSPWSMISHQGSSEQVGNAPLQPIAIIGMSCRLPGSAQDPSSLWELLASGRTAWTPGPGNRFNMKAFQDPSGQKAATVSTRSSPSCGWLAWVDC